MKINQLLTDLKNWHCQLRALLPDNTDVGDIGTKVASLSPESQFVLKNLSFNLYRDIQNLHDELSSDLLESGEIYHRGDPDLLAYYTQKIAPDINLISTIFETLDPSRFALFQLLQDPSGRRTALGHVYGTFVAGIEKMDTLIEDWPEYREHFLVDSAREILTSPLLRFEPDQWIERTAQLRSVLTQRADLLPGQILLRLVEVYRSYIFGNWLSVIVLARSVLEYSILDNCSKLEIDPKRSNDNQKNLAELIDDVARHLPQLKQTMNYLRDKGNETVHPKETEDSKEWSDVRQEVAKKCVEYLIAIVEELYLSQKA